MQAHFVPLVAMGLSVFVAAPLLGQDGAGDKSSATSTTTTDAAAGVAFPDLSGPYKVGRTSYALMDSSRKEVFTSEPDNARELVITVHYPAEAPSGRSPALTPTPRSPPRLPKRITCPAPCSVRYTRTPLTSPPQWRRQVVFRS